MGSGRAGRWKDLTRRGWVSCIFTAVALFAITLAISLYFGGLGIVRSHGEYILRQGLVRKPIDQRIGFLFQFVSLSSFAASIGALVLSAIVFLEWGSIRFTEVFGAAGQKIRSRLMVLALAACTLVAIALALRACS